MNLENISIVWNTMLDLLRDNSTIQYIYYNNRI